MNPSNQKNLTAKMLKNMLKTADDDDVVLIADYRTMENLELKAKPVSCVIIKNDSIILQG
jgi:hypothetical protein